MFEFAFENKPLHGIYVIDMLTWGRNTNVIST